MFSKCKLNPAFAALRPEALSALYPDAEDRAAWQGVSSAGKEEILREAERYASLPYPMRKATDFLAFVRTGSRQADEDPYFFRRRKLCVAALACCLGAEAYLDDVIDGVWCVCEESSWVISAHNVNPIPGAPPSAEYPLPDIGMPYIDLFSAQTAMILSLIRRLLGRRLDGAAPILTRRIEDEIRRRVLTPFMENDDFWWMGFRRKDLCNWTPWIVSNVMLSACLYPPERDGLPALLVRACGMLDRWLDCVPEDGGCDEGVGYWNMAGGALLDCLELLETVTGGRLTFWEKSKIRNILSFPRKAALGGGWFVNFADCDARPVMAGERLQLAGEKLGDPALAALGASLRGPALSQLSDVPHFSRLLRALFHPAPESAAAPAAPEDAWLPDLQLRVIHRAGMTLCCKGGHNGESHNHNDVGSFMLYAEGRPEIVDAGCMRYTAATFSDKRYTLWNTRSAYHNVPLVNGCEQLPGRGFAARDVRSLPDGLALDMAGAYGPEAGLRALLREMTLTRDGLTLRDRIQLRGRGRVMWVFLLRNEPAFGPGELAAGNIRMRFPAEWQAAAEAIPVEDSRMAGSFPGRLWRVRLTAPEAESLSLELTVRKKDDP